MSIWNKDLSFIYNWIGSIGMIGLGVWMFVDPTLQDGAVAEGRKKLYKQITIWVWGYPGGVAFILLGSFLLYREIQALSNRQK